MLSAPLTAEQSFQRAQALLQTGRSVALPELLHLIETLSSSDATIPEIAELIEKDPVLLSRVLSLANTVAHNPGISPIRTLSQALHRIGYQRVRTLAVSLLLLESAGGRDSSPEQREAAGQALCAGLLAQGTAETLGTHDPELAFACATLRHFGRVLMATISAEHYRTALQLGAENPPEENGFRRRFGVTSLDLGRRVLTAARVAPEVIATLRENEPESLALSGSRHDTRLVALAEFGSRLAALSLASHSATDGFVKHTRQVTRRFERIWPDLAGCLVPAFRLADQRLNSFLRCKGVARLPSLNLLRVRQRLETIAPEVLREGDGSIGALLTAHLPAHAQAASTAAPGPGETSPAPGTGDLGPILSAASAAAPSPPASQDAPDAPASGDLPTEISVPSTAATANDAAARNTARSLSFSESLPTAPTPPPAESHPPAPPASTAPKLPDHSGAIPALPALASSPPAETGDSAAAALDLIRTGFAAEECWLFYQSPGDLSHRLISGLGTTWQEVQPRAALRADERSVFGVCLARGETVVIHDAYAASTWPHLPDWLRDRADAAGAFVLIPLAAGGRTPGLALVGWHRPRPISLTAAQLALARQILSALLPSATPARSAA